LSRRGPQLTNPLGQPKQCREILSGSQRSSGALRCCGHFLLKVAALTGDQACKVLSARWETTRGITGVAGAVGNRPDAARPKPGEIPSRLPAWHRFDPICTLDTSMSASLPMHQREDRGERMTFKQNGSGSCYGWGLANRGRHRKHPGVGGSHSPKRYAAGSAESGRSSGRASPGWWRLTGRGVQAQ